MVGLAIGDGTDIDLRVTLEDPLPPHYHCLAPWQAWERFIPGQTLLHRHPHHSPPVKPGRVILGPLLAGLMASTMHCFHVKAT
jgi:hypothetical protein